MKKLFVLATVIVLVAICVRSVRADNAATSASVTNALPVSSGVMLAPEDATITLTENTTTNVIVTATVTDDNGCEDISSVSVKIFRTDLTASCSNDANNCYTQAATMDSGTCTSGGSDLSSTWTATIPVQYYADPTDVGSTYASTTWSAHVTPSDSIGGTAGSDDIKEMSTLTALNVTSSIAYGALALGADTGTTDQTTVVTNTGNISIGTQLDGYGSVSGDGKSMICSIGSTIVGNEKYSITALQDYSTSKIDLEGTAATVASFTVAKATSGTPSTSNIYWGFGMPTSGISGSCMGTVVFTAI